MATNNTVIPIDIPDNTDSIHHIGDFIMSYQPYQNAFVTALVNRIARVIITSKLWTNPWNVFKRGYLEFGETVEEIFVNIAKPFSFDPETAEKNVYKREIPDVRAAFHSMNFQKFYKVTISNDQLRQAFLSWEGITDLIARIVDSLYTAMEYDEFVTMKYMLAREILNGGLSVNVVPAIVGDNYKPLVSSFRGESSQLTFLTNRYNRAGVMNATPREDQFIIIDSALEANIDVEVLAAAFNLDRADFLGHLIIVDSWSEHDYERLELLFGDDPSYAQFTGNEITSLQNVKAAVVARDWWMVFDNFNQFTQNYNGEGLYWNYWYHVWKTFSVSPFANARVFTTQASEITAVTVSPATANVTQGSDMVFTETVTGTGLVDRSVTWSISGQTVTDTQINPNSGRLHVAATEPVGTKITVTATAIEDGQTGTATVTVTAVATGAAETQSARASK